MALIIEEVAGPFLIAHNRPLRRSSATSCGSSFEQSVEYFVSYYDY